MDAETGLYYNRFRYFDAEDGRYVTQDPIGLASGEPGFYNYVSEPNGWLDVDGLLRRPYIRKSTRIAVESKAKVKNGRFVDSNTGKPISGGKRRNYSRAEGEYHLGHKPDHEHWRELRKAERKGWDQKKFNDYMNNPDLFQIEDPKENMSHKHEKKRNSYNKMKSNEFKFFDDEILYEVILQDEFAKLEEFLNQFGLNSRDREGSTLLMNCIVEKRNEFVKKLIGLGVDINAQDFKGFSALHKATQENNLEALKLLIGCKDLNINIQDSWGNSPLWRGLMNDVSEEIVIALLIHGANIDLKNHSDVSPRDLLDESYTEVAKWLKDNS